LIQKRGTGHVGRMFGPVMLVWFSTIGALGIFHVIKHPAVLAALSPTYAAAFFVHHGFPGVAVLGSVVLAVTGGEALYADMGHFGAKPIRLGWMALVMPSLILCYFGQGALILSNPAAADSPFYSMVPAGAATYALVALSAAATVIASQALISGAFSLTHQAVQLGLFPRVEVRHTSREAEGQIYVPGINWLLAAACITLVIWRQKSENLAAAYGIAVTGTMAITSIVYFVVVRKTWGWSLLRALPLVALFLSFDVPFFAANLVKFVEGGWVPLLVAAMFFIVMVTWRRGRRILSEVVAKTVMPLDAYLEQFQCQTRTKGTGVFMTSLKTGVPPVVTRHADRIRALPERVVILNVMTEHVPIANDDSRVEVETLTHGFFRINGRYGFMESPDVPAIVKRGLAMLNIDAEKDGLTYFVGHETFLATSKGQMGPLTEGLFAYLSRNSLSASTHFALPPDQVVELGSHIDL
jgi:KUP system potassium uptake protein